MNDAEIRVNAMNMTVVKTYIRISENNNFFILLNIIYDAKLF